MHQLVHANYVSTGQTVKSRPVVTIELQDFMKANAWKVGAVVESVIRELKHTDAAAERRRSHSNFLSIKE